MIRLRTHSIRYETGFTVATKRNQSTPIRFRGVFIEERKRKTKSSGKRPWIASPEPVRSAQEDAERAEADRDQGGEARRASRSRAGRRRNRTPMIRPTRDVERRLDEAEDQPRRRAGRRSARHRASSVSESRFRKPVWMSLREVGAGVHGREERALDERDRERERRRKESVGKPGSSVDGLQAARVHEQQQHREDQREDDRRRLAARADDRAPRDRADLWQAMALTTAGSAASGFVLAGTLQRPAGLGEEDVVERGRLDLEACERRARRRRLRGRRPGSPASPSRSRTTTSPEPRAERLTVGRERGDEPLAIGLVGRDRVNARQPDLGLERRRCRPRRRCARGR